MTSGNEHAIAREMRDADGIARHGIEGWRLLTSNWETTVDVLRRQLEWQRIELRDQRDALQKAKASLRKAYRDNRALKARLAEREADLRALHRKARKPLQRKARKHA